MVMVVNYYNHVIYIQIQKVVDMIKIIMIVNG